MEQSKGDPCVFCKVVDEDILVVVGIHVDDLVVAIKEKEVFGGSFMQLLVEFPVTDIGDLSWYLGCTFEREKTKGDVKMI